MRVLFLKDVPGVALGGDVKEVKNGYARNYLIPYNIAVLANNESMKQIEKIKVESEKERIALMKDLKAVFESVKDLTINIKYTEAKPPLLTLNILWKSQKNPYFIDFFTL